jgi:transposase-like protein
MLKFIILSLNKLEEVMSNTQGRWSSQKKAELVLRLLRGESIDSVSREYSVTL